ncbi:hypothetical protein E5P55_00030 [Candidatus Pinguicoccus supinus]|uniref:Translation elongation factor EFTs/EF1B dimerisation domain-containing protein n=1 Tax=Candidatus Pinguicoccus supinus TaxID=2529394 RepID=A0A7T0BRA9_9BACT|nr:hypothetical protein E5P55_00030 [Candidatus Pinguicoccus supinus]
MDKNLLLNIQNFRKLTNLSLKECKDILTKNDLNFKKALDYYSNEYRISLSGLSDNIKVCENGMTFSYVHHNYKLGVILNVMCNTDFVSKNELFYELIKNLSIHIASTSPLFLNLYSINCDLLLKKRRHFFNEARRTARSKKDLTSIFQSYLHS